MLEPVPYCYCFVRSDLSPAQQIVQIGHACLEAGKNFQHAPNTHMVIFRVKDQGRLMFAALELEQADVKYACFYETDNETGYTAIATEPVYGEKRALFQGFALI